VANGTLPERDNIHASHQRALARLEKSRVA
jgi:hypothetical protein